MAHEGSVVEALSVWLHGELLARLLELLDSVEQVVALGVLIQIALVKD